MTNDVMMAFWRLATDYTVEDAAILMAGGDPSEKDFEIDTFGHDFPVKKTIGHPGFLTTFTGLKNAVRKGHLRAELAYETERPNSSSSHLTGRTWLLTSLDLSKLKQQMEADIGFGVDPSPPKDALRVSLEPDWTRTTIEAEDLKAWLRSRGVTTGFFFPSGESTERDAETFLDPLHDRFAPELALAISAWRALEKKTGFTRGSKEALGAWIDANPGAWRGEGKLSGGARDRIVTVANWNKSGGAPISGA